MYSFLKIRYRVWVFIYVFCWFLNVRVGLLICVFRGVFYRGLYCREVGEEIVVFGLRLVSREMVLGAFILLLLLLLLMFSFLFYVVGCFIICRCYSIIVECGVLRLRVILFGILFGT